MSGDRLGRSQTQNPGAPFGEELIKRNTGVSGTNLEDPLPERGRSSGVLPSLLLLFVVISGLLTHVLFRCHLGEFVSFKAAGDEDTDALRTLAGGGPVLSRRHVSGTGVVLVQATDISEASSWGGVVWSLVQEEPRWLTGAC
jgi:hypothetical protein